jgi:hypothetical protein
VVIPAHCPSGLHVLTEVGYDASEGDYPGGNYSRILRVACRACSDLPRADYTWSLMTGGQPADSAEFDDEPYATLMANHRGR